MEFIDAVPVDVFLSISLATLSLVGMGLTYLFDKRQNERQSSGASTDIVIHHATVATDLDVLKNKDYETVTSQVGDCNVVRYSGHSNCPGDDGKFVCVVNENLFRGVMFITRSLELDDEQRQVFAATLQHCRQTNQSNPNSKSVASLAHHRKLQKLIRNLSSKKDAPVNQPFGDCVVPSNNVNGDISEVKPDINESNDIWSEAETSRDSEIIQKQLVSDLAKGDCSISLDEGNGLDSSSSPSQRLEEKQLSPAETRNSKRRAPTERSVIFKQSKNTKLSQLRIDSAKKNLLAAGSAFNNWVPPPAKQIKTDRDLMAAESVSKVQHSRRE